MCTIFPIIIYNLTGIAKVFWFLTLQYKNTLIYAIVIIMFCNLQFFTIQTKRTVVLYSTLHDNSLTRNGHADQN